MDSANIAAMIQGSRRDLESARFSLRRIYHRSPRELSFSALYPRWARLMGEQAAMERAAGLGGAPGRLGFIIPIIAGGAALAALGAWAFRQQRKTSEYKSYVECLERRIEAGMPEGEAAQVCSGAQAGVLHELSKMMTYGMIITIALGGIWAISKFKS